MHAATTRRTTKVVLILICGASCTAAPAAPPEANRPTVGARARITAPSLDDQPIIGVVTATTDDQVSVRIASRDEPVVVPRARISRFELSSGTSGRAAHAVAGALLGALVGAVVGGSDRGGLVPHQNIVAGLAASGALLGGGIGALVPGREQWRDVPLADGRWAVRSCAPTAVCVAVAF